MALPKFSLAAQKICPKFGGAAAPLAPPGPYAYGGPNLFYLRVDYVFESCFSIGIVQRISMIFAILNKEWSNFKKMLFIFLQVKKRLRYRLCKNRLFTKNVNNFETLRFFSNFGK